MACEDLPGPGMEYVSPPLIGKFLTNGPLQKSLHIYIYIFFNRVIIHFRGNSSLALSASSFKFLLAYTVRPINDHFVLILFLRFLPVLLSNNHCNFIIDFNNYQGKISYNFHTFIFFLLICQNKL